MGFVSLMSWKCDYIEQMTVNKDPYKYGSGIHEAKLTKTLFCDDPSYSAITMRGAKALAKAVGMFAAATGMELNLKKSFWVAMDCPESKGSVIEVPMPELDSQKRKADNVWEYKEMNKTKIAQLSPTTPWRHLGNYQDLSLIHI